MARLKKPVWVQMQDGNYRTTVGPLVIEVRPVFEEVDSKWDHCISFFKPDTSSPTHVWEQHGTPLAQLEHAQKAGFTLARKYLKIWIQQVKPVNKASKKRWGRGKKSKRTGV